MPEVSEWLRAALATAFVHFSGLILWFCGYDGGGLLSPKQWLQSSPLGRQLCESSLGLLQQRNNSTCMKKLPKQRHAMTLGHF